MADTTASTPPAHTATPPSAKRKRTDDDESSAVSTESSSSRPRPPHPPENAVLEPSVFRTKTVDDVLRQVADFLYRYIDMNNPHIEVEAKLGLLIDKHTRQRIQLPIVSEAVLKDDGSFRFESNMTMAQHHHFNNLLNSLVVPGCKLRYTHRKEVDQFYRNRGSKIRVSVDEKTGQVIPGGVVEKKRIADLNVHMPNAPLDYRISVNVEMPAKQPSDDQIPEFRREKDRLSYRHEICQVDLTQVKSVKRGDTELMHELEVEFIRSADLVTEIRKAGKNQPNRFYEYIGILLNNNEFTMFRNQYDNDITIWSPQGRIHQIEYAMEAVKQGSAAVGVRSNTHAVLLALKRSQGELASYQKKIIKIDEHMGIAIAGLMSDARVLSNFMRTEAMRSRMIYNRPLPTYRIVSAISDKAQANTQRYGRRPYGVGLLVIGYDETGPHLYECAPSGNFFDYIAMSVGARSQSAKTYLEKHFQSFAESTLDELIVHGLRSLRDTLQQDKELNINNCSIAIVGKGQKFQIIEGEELQKWLDLLGQSDATMGNAGDAEAPAAAGEGEAAAQSPTPMDTE
ncbi:hypothetical protein HK102_000161 [Quaeritorhiza haematococci]|nr:hypothetical protein HK102_000161 [Quaeritorhiza haematococci]